MMPRKLLALLLTVGMVGCGPSQKKKASADTYPDIKVVGALKNVMLKGQLQASIELDTISNKKGLYGLGPESYLTGELLINNGIGYLAKVTSDSTMKVEKRFDVSAPFFVYANVTEWSKKELPPNVKSIKDLEELIDEHTKNYKRPFSFYLKGLASKAHIHLQNLPAGMIVSSPEEAHQGQVNYELNDTEVEIVGFFSTEHQGVFTHHDSFLHMHLITHDESKMGHLDQLEIKNMDLYLPKK